MSPVACARSGRGSTASGMGVALSLHLLQIFIGPAVATAGSHFPRYGAIVALYGWWATEFIYLAPAAAHYYNRGKFSTVKGILIVAGLGILLNSGCNVLFFRTMRNAM